MNGGGVIETARATAVVLAFTSVALVVCYGLGRLLGRLWRVERCGTPEVDTTAWIGWGAAVAVIQIWHLALRPGWVLALLLCCAGAAGLLLARDDVRALAGAVWRTHARLAVAVVLVALWLANTSLGPPRNGDSGLYHLQAVRWAATFPDVPGLANLLGRLGFTSSYTLYLALPEALAGTGRGCHLANAALLLLPIARGLWALALAAGGRSRWTAGTLFDVLAVFPLVERVWSEQVLASATPDLPVFVLGIVLTSLLLRAVEARDDHDGTDLRVAAVVWLAAVGVTVKLSFAAFALAAAALALFVGARRVRRDAHGAFVRRGFVPLAVCCAMVVVPWLVRSVVLSGYPLYPFPGLSVAVDWRVSRTAALDDYNWVRSWARRPGADWHAVLGTWSWFPGWVRRLTGLRYTLLTFCLPLAVAVVSLAVAAFARRRHAGGSEVLLALAPAGVSLVYWFATAPEPRLAGSAAWVLGLGAASAAGASLVPVGASRTGRVPALIALGLGGALLLVMLWRRGLLPVAAGPDGGFHPAPTPVVETVRTKSGVEVIVPVGAEACWNAPIPCTPYLDPALRLRRGAELRWGFATAAPRGDHDR